MLNNETFLLTLNYLMYIFGIKFHIKNIYQSIFTMKIFIFARIWPDVTFCYLG